MLVDKQKPSKSKKSHSNAYSNMQNNNTNQHKRSNSSQNIVNNNHSRNHQNRNNYLNSPTKSSQNNINNTFGNNYQNGNNYSKSNTYHSYDDKIQRNHPSTSNSGISFNQKNLSQNGNHSSGKVTDRLRAYLEFNLSQSQKVLLYSY